jgi:hypothetical protein
MSLPFPEHPLRRAIRNQLAPTSPLVPMIRVPQ